MKKIFAILVVLFVFMTIVPKNVSASDLPPALPSSFWGVANRSYVGATVKAVCDKTIVTTKTFFAILNGKRVIAYSLDMNGEHKEGTPINFYVNGRLVGTSSYHSGTNSRFDLSAYFWFLNK